MMGMAAVGEERVIITETLPSNSYINHGGTILIFYNEPFAFRVLHMIEALPNIKCPSGLKQMHI